MGKKIGRILLSIFLVLMSLAFLSTIIVLCEYVDSLPAPGTHVLDEGHGEDCVSTNTITVWYQIGSDKPVADKKITFTLKEPYGNAKYSTTEAALDESGYIKIDLPKPPCKRGSVDLVLTLEGTKLNHLDRLYLQ